MVRIGPSHWEYLGPAARDMLAETAGRVAPWRYEVTAESDGLAAHLTFTGTLPPWRPGAGKNYYAPI